MVSLGLVGSVFFAAIVTIIVTFAYVVIVDVMTPERRETVNKKKKSVKGRA
ncbi:hypothetical protein [Sulfuracidifex metallicus]|jgi:hypothetical protein|uniref:hypothetical protein n=1 Tax=Sulfuracidifex metallicus TaxID=47303 RepID=UPI0022733236|nr:hypothetical protein [Sulfuracidifex metallicus]MCY0850136.1 hypothetical protein [Sulfuracidifex metallicus]